MQITGSGRAEVETWGMRSSGQEAVRSGENVDKEKEGRKRLHGVYVLRNVNVVAIL